MLCFFEPLNPILQFKKLSKKGKNNMFTLQIMQLAKHLFTQIEMQCLFSCRIK